MKYTFFGFNQEKLIQLDLDLIDAAILRFFIDFKDSGDMVMKIIDEKPYYWLKYEYLIQQIPIIKVKSKDALRRRLKKLVESGVLIHKTFKEGGTFSLYGIGENYKFLIKNYEEGYDSKVGGGTTQKSEGYDSKVGTNNYSIKDSSIKEIICYLNSKIGTRYKPTSKETVRLIKARLKEGFSIDDFKEVIDKKTNEWIKTDFEKYLRPSTLFNQEKFEIYLNQKANVADISKTESTSSYDNFNFNYE